MDSTTNVPKMDGRRERSLQILLQFPTMHLSKAAMVDEPHSSEFPKNRMAVPRWRRDNGGGGDGS